MSGPIKGVSSYDKICKHLRYTQDFSNLSEAVFKILDRANVAGWQFSPGGEDGDDDPRKRRNVAPPRWELQIDWGKFPNGRDNIEEVNGNLRTWQIDLNTIVPVALIHDVAEKNFGTKTCPTYFCHKYKLLGRNKKGESEGTDKWRSFATSELRSQLLDKITRTEEKLRDAMMAAYTSPEFEQAKVQYHERCIAEDIKKVLIKYSSVAKPHVLKMALDEFIAHEIMES